MPRSSGHRAEGTDDIRAIRESVALPVIGVCKNLYPGSPVHITPAFDDAAAAFQAGADVLAVDGTQRRRPRGEDLGRLIERIHAELGVAVMADVSSLQDGVHAASLGADALASTLSGYVDGSPATTRPDLPLGKALSAAVAIPVIAEGRYHDPADAAMAIALGAYAVVVGTAITRPHLITERFASALRRQLS